MDIIFQSGEFYTETNSFLSNLINVISACNRKITMSQNRKIVMYNFRKITMS